MTLTLQQLSALWLEDLTGQVDATTLDMYRLYWNTHLAPHFGGLDGITTAAIADYSRKRLRVVKRKTVQKERSALRGFLAWCSELGHLERAPELAPLPRRAQGTPFALRRRGTATPLSPEDCRRLLATLPEWIHPRTGPRYAVRARFVVAYETTLRPATLSALTAPDHYSRGAKFLVITDDIDKARFGREVPLTRSARAALDSVVPDAGLIFGKHNYRAQLSRAAKLALTQAQARTFTAYDLRHAKLTELAETGNLTGAAYIGGHRHVTTTNAYIKPGLRAAQRALESLAELQKKTPSSPILGARKRGRTSTTFRSLEPESCHVEKSSRNGEIGSIATDLLRRAAADEQVERSELVAFARQVLALSEAGRLALAILDADEHWPRRVLELAQLVVADAERSARSGKVSHE